MQTEPLQTQLISTKVLVPGTNNPGQDLRRLGELFRPLRLEVCEIQYTSRRGTARSVTEFNQRSEWLKASLTNSGQTIRLAGPDS